jgi:RNA recognition motif-containing protein
MERKLYVGNLSYDTTSDSLREAFGSAGTVEDAIVITDKMSGRSKGFGFVTMATEDEAKAAIEMFEGKELDGREVRVNEARPQEPRN